VDALGTLAAEVERLDVLMLPGKRLLAALIARQASRHAPRLRRWRPDALHLFPFRYWDDVRGKWVRARYVAEFREISERHRRFEIVGDPELRVVRRGHFPTPGNLR
jgi:hypothetical protein